MLEITEPLHLGVGSLAAPGQGCAMNLVSWTNGDVEITDYPKCSDRVLSQLVQNFNDICCRCAIPRQTWACLAHHDVDCIDIECAGEDAWDYVEITRAGYGDEGDVICAEHAVIAIGLGFRTVGTGGWTELNGYGVWLDIATERAPDKDHGYMIGLIAATAPEYRHNIMWDELDDDRKAEILDAWKSTQILQYIEVVFQVHASDNEQEDTVANINAIIDAFYRHTHLAPEPVETERINEAARKMASA